MLIGSILNPGRGQTPPPQSQPQPAPRPSEPAPAAEPAPVAAEPEPSSAPPPTSPAPAPAPSAGTSSPVDAQPTSVAAALSANPSSRSDYRAMGSWIASGTVAPVTVAATTATVAGDAAQATAPTRDAILRDAWGAVLSQANVSRGDVIDLLR